MRMVFVLTLSLLSGLLAGETLTVGDFRLALAKGYFVLPPDEQQRTMVRTPAGHPIAIVSLSQGFSMNWESVALEYLLTEYRNSNPKILPNDIPEEISLKREGPWTTLFWTYGGTKAFFGMYWGGRANDQGALLFWASPTKVQGRSQYQALSEITKGVIVNTDEIP